MTAERRDDRPTRGRDLGRRAARLALALVAVGVGACSSPPPPTAPTTPPPAGSPPPAAVPLDVRFAGRIGCATFPYNCTATLSVLEPGTDVPDAWRPPPSDPWWGADDSQGTTAQTFDPKPLGGSPATIPGLHRLVVSLLGSYDTPSYGPDGSRAFDLLSRCTTDVVVPAAGGLDVLITFTPDEASFRASCTVVAGKP